MRAGRQPGRDGAARLLAIVGQVQAFGLTSAAAVADRYVGTVDRYLAERGGPAGAPPGSAGEDPTDVGARLERVLLRSLELVTTGLDGRGSQPGAEGSAEVLELPPVIPGGSTRGSVWVHNATAAPVVVMVRAGPLTSAGGEVLTPTVQPAGPAPGGASVSPSASAEVPAGGAVELWVGARVPALTGDGHFHGVLTSTAAPRRAMTVLLEVRRPQGGGT